MLRTRSGLRGPAPTRGKASLSPCPLRQLLLSPSTATLLQGPDPYPEFGPRPFTASTRGLPAPPAVVQTLTIARRSSLQCHRMGAVSCLAARCPWLSFA